jgi:error-prone DNA polymerase
MALGRPFRDTGDLARRAELDTRELRCLARAGALATLAGNRHAAHWEAAGIRRLLPLERTREVRVPLAQANGACEVRDTSAAPDLPTPTAASNLFDDYRYLGLTLGPHPMTLLRAHAELGRAVKRCWTARQPEDSRHGQFVRVAGMVTGRQRPGTTTGVLFVTLEDETGNVNVVVWASILERFQAALLQGRLLRIRGVVEREREVIHVVAGRVEDLTRLLDRLGGDDGPGSDPFRSRDFH